MPRRAAQDAGRPAHTALDRRDLLAGAIVALAAAVVAAWGFLRLGDVLYSEASLDLWFQADCPRVVANLLDATSNQYRANVHPAVALLTTPWLSVMASASNVPLTYAKALIVAVGAISASALTFAIRLNGARRIDALVYGLLLAASAAYVHWYSVVEIAALNGLSICLVLLVASSGSRSGVAWALASAASLGMTVTNWSAGLVAAFTAMPIRRAIGISLCALVIVAGVALVQKAVYPTAGLFLDPHSLAKEREYSTARRADWTPLDSVRSLLLSSVIAPTPELKHSADRYVVSNQGASVWRSGWLAAAAGMAWAICLVSGIIAAIRAKARRRFVLGLAGMTAAQVGLGAIYGDESFLYAATILPMLVMTASFSALAPWRGIARTSAVVAVIAGGASNLTEFGRASDLASQALTAGGNPLWSQFPAGRIILPRPPPQPKDAP